jgi:flagellar biosynthesis protein FlhF
MRIKKILAKNYSEALAQVKNELGEDALIISTRSLEPDPRSDGTENAGRVEITAAFEPQEKDENVRGEGAVGNPQSLRFHEDDLDLKALIFSLLTRTERAQSLGLKSHQLVAYSQMVDSGLSERLAAKIIEKASVDDSAEKPGPQSESQIIRNLMKRALLCNGEIKLDGKKTKKVVFVGPTGAGKTTTIAKLAADFAFRQKKKVAMATLDTYRMGALDQLRIYGDIMRIPVETAHNRDELQAIVKKHADKDLLLIDTAGKSPKEKDYSNQLQGILKDLGDVETQLVLSVTAQEKIFLESVKQFSQLGIDRVLFTKMDEGMSFGALFNFSLRTRIPFSYFTMGQRVPEDIEVANREKVIKLIFN